MKKQRIKSIRFTEADEARLIDEAQAAGMTFGQYLRHKVLVGEPASGVRAVPPKSPVQPLPDQEPTRGAAPPTEDPHSADSAVPASVKPQAASRLQRGKLDSLGQDPLRGGQRSQKR